MITVLTAAILINLSLCSPPVESMETQNEDEIVFRVVNGSPAKVGEFPYQVSLKRYHASGAYVNFCGGSILGRDKILTAGHCVTRDGNSCDKCLKQWKLKDFSNVYAVAGTINTFGSYVKDDAGTEQWRGIRKALLPNGYWFTTNDIGLLFITAPFVMNAYVSPLPPAYKDQDYGSIKCLVSGYGRLNNRVLSKTLMYAWLQLIPRYQCSRIHRKDMWRYICTSSYSTDVLQGDSGGPLVCKGTGDPNDKGSGVIVGVVSGAKIEYSGRPHTYFTRVSSFDTFYSQSEAIASKPLYYIIWLLQIINIINKYVLTY